MERCLEAHELGDSKMRRGWMEIMTAMGGLWLSEDKDPVSVSLPSW